MAQIRNNSGEVISMTLHDTDIRKRLMKHWQLQLRKTLPMNIIVMPRYIVYCDIPYGRKI